MVLLAACGDDPATAAGDIPGPLADAGPSNPLPTDAGLTADSAPFPPPGQRTDPEAGLQPTSQLDPNATFDWPEAKPGSGRRCQGGTYSGTWTCSSFGIIPFDGDVTLRFVESMDGEFLELADGRLGGLVGEGLILAEGDFRFDGQLVGRLDCTTLEFSAQISMGEYKRHEPYSNTYEPFGTFEGTLEGSLDPELQQIRGEWSLLADVFVDCVGPWTAMLQP